MSKARFNNLSDLLNNINIPVHEIRDAVALADTNSQRITDHENATDPHPQYYNQTRGDSRYVQVTTLAQPNGVATLDNNSKITFNQIPDAALGGLSYQGSWNANTNTPALFSGQGTRGYFYKVSVQGSTDLDGITDWKIGDWAIFDGAAWQKLDQTEIIQSVNGKTGDVVLTTDDISEGLTNLYFTDQRASDAAPVQTVYGRIGVVVAEDGDYSASQVVFDASSSDLTNTRVQSAIVELNTKTNNHINDGGDPHPQYTTTTEAANAAPVQSVDGQTGNVVLNYDNYGGWELRTDGTSRGNIDSGEVVNFVGGSNVSLAYSATNNTITISSVDTNTDTNFYLDGLTFNPADGVITASVNGAANQTVDLDGRYLLTTGKAADSDLLDGQDSTFYRNASNLNAGTISDARLPATITSDITGNAATATNSDQLDGLDSTDFYRKRQTLTSSDDLNTITQEGLYGWNASVPANAPNNLQYCSMFVTNDGSQAIQYVFGTINGNAWVRRANSGVFGAFIRVYTDSYHPIADALTTARQIALSGDVSGSANFDGSANITINATVADDSHDHTIGNIDGLQTALDDIDAKDLRESLLKEATLNLDFANNNYEIYEGPVNSLTGRPFNDVVTFTRASVATARNAIGGLTPVGVDDHRLIGNREGLLIEGNRTNVHPASEDFSNTLYWTPSNANVTVNTDTAPDGTLTADSITTTTVNGYLVTRSNTVVFPASTSGVASIYVKDLPSGSSVRILDGAGASLPVPAELTTQSAITEWTRLELPFTSSSDGYVRIFIRPNIITTFKVWGNQVEQGSFPTSYIKTEATTQVRNGDYASVDTLTPWFNPTEGTIYVEWINHDIDGRPIAIASSVSQRIGIMDNGGDLSVLWFSGSGSTEYIDLGITTQDSLGQLNRCAFSYQSGKLEASLNGGASITLIPAVPDVPVFSYLDIGQHSDVSGSLISGTIPLVVNIPRVLTSTELQALTSGE